jgi:hypothetical protein
VSVPRSPPSQHAGLTFSLARAQGDDGAPPEDGDAATPEGGEEDGEDGGASGQEEDEEEEEEEEEEDEEAMLERFVAEKGTLSGAHGEEDGDDDGEGGDGEVEGARAGQLRRGVSTLSSRFGRAAKRCSATHAFSPALSC